MRAIASASPFFKIAVARAVYAEGVLKRMVHVAVAVRCVEVFEVTDIICAAPEEFRCESVGVESEGLDEVCRR